MQKKSLWLLICLLLAPVAAGGNHASTRFVVNMPEVLMLRVNGQSGGNVPVTVSNGRVSPETLHVEVLANTGWRLTVRSTPLRGPLNLPPSRLNLAGLELAEFEQLVRLGRGPAAFDLPLSVDLHPGEPLGDYHALITFELYKL